MSQNSPTDENKAALVAVLREQIARVEAGEVAGLAVVTYEPKAGRPTIALTGAYHLLAGGLNYAGWEVHRLMRGIPAPEG